MAGEHLEAAIRWITSSKENTEKFQASFDVIKTQFPALEPTDLDILRTLHTKGLEALDEVLPDVQGMRSFGW